MKKMFLSSQHVNELINKALNNLEKDWREAGFLSEDFKAKRQKFKKVIYNEMLLTYSICSGG